MNKTRILFGFVFIVLVIGGYWFATRNSNSEPGIPVKISNFEECVAAGNPVMESYPRQCRANGQTFVEQISIPFSYEEALAVARKNQDCAAAGILSDKYVFNENTKTWWIDLVRTAELEKDGCKPACVVSESTRSAEVNWRCIGLLVPAESDGSSGETLCSPQQRGGDACMQIYDPVCAVVDVQCIKAPCDPILKTYSNSCEACRNSLARSYTKGECE